MRAYSGFGLTVKQWPRCRLPYNTALQEHDCRYRSRLGTGRPMLLALSCYRISLKVEDQDVGSVYSILSIRFFQQVDLNDRSHWLRDLWR